MVNRVYSKTGEALKTNFLLHPGEVLLDEIETRKLSRSAIAAEINVLPGHLSEMFSGERSITAMNAVKLEKALGISAEFWLSLQNDYDLAKARRILET